ncbi:MAG: hypothetical protein P0S94_03910, partial [Simkaniaceae bacterium]|nr:hypothetical protein [Simkaniaceae bacterium]
SHPQNRSTALSFPQTAAPATPAPFSVPSKILVFDSDQLSHKSGNKDTVFYKTADEYISQFLP